MAVPLRNICFDRTNSFLSYNILYSLTIRIAKPKDFSAVKLFPITFNFHLSTFTLLSALALSSGCVHVPRGGTSEAGVRAQPLVARIDVQQAQPFGGIPAVGAHSLNAVLTDRGIYVVEPQTRALAPLAAYPNRGQIFRVRIGG